MRRWPPGLPRPPGDPDLAETSSVFSIGHGTRPVEELIELLQEAGARRLVDVRTVPGSRRNPQHGRSALESALADAGIDYVWRKDLGGFRSPSPGSPNTALRNGSFRGYADYMATEEFARAIGWLLDTSRDVTTAFMCAETVWWRCHRRMIADALAVRGVTTLHLMAPGKKPQAHRLHPAARTLGTQLVYDQEQVQ